MKMFISPSEETKWVLDPDQLSARMREFAPQIEFRSERSCSEAHRIEWTWATPDGPVEGSLDTECTGIALDGEVRRCAEFAVWFRTLVPREQELLFYDEGYSGDLVISSESTVEDLAAPFLG